MTAEIAILNREAVAIAADSAVTMTHQFGHKIFTSANKIFTISKFQPVAVMVFGSAAFMGMPWEAIIKSYRQRIWRKSFTTVEGYAGDFLKYIQSNRQFSPVGNQRAFVLYRVTGYFEMLKKEARKKFDEAKLAHASVTERDLKRIFAAVIADDRRSWQDAPYCLKSNSAQMRRIAQLYRREFAKAKADVFEKMPFTRAAVADLYKIAAMILVKRNRLRSHESRSGLVFAGFGTRDLYPKCIDYSIEGVAGNRLLAVQGDTLNGSQVVIRPFAQDDVVRGFVEGIDPSLEAGVWRNLESFISQYPSVLLDLLKVEQGTKKRTEIEKSLGQVAGSLIQALRAKLRETRRKGFIDPVLNVVGMLPKDELANMAETLVNLTSFKRKMSTSPESVGGPVDVAVISKGDGFVWIKRKHYFKPELNQSFFANYHEKLI